MTGRLVLFLPFIFLVGCQPSDEIPDLHPLTGTVTRDGKPLTTGGGLIFAPESGGWGGVVVDANIDWDGTFAAQTSKVTGTKTVFQPGVKPGRYKVTYHPRGNGEKTGQQSELPVVVVVEAKSNVVTLELPSKATAGSGEPRDDANPTGKTEPKKD